MWDWLKSWFDPYSAYTTDENVRAALMLLDDYTLKIIENNSIKIEWSQLGKQGDTDLFVCKGKDVLNNNYILLNSKYQDAPPEQLACLIIHETCHISTVVAISQEEVAALSIEGATWKNLKRDVEYEDTPLYRRLESLSKLSYEQIVSFVDGQKSRDYDKVVVL